MGYNDYVIKSSYTKYEAILILLKQKIAKGKVPKCYFMTTFLLARIIYFINEKY
jgi:hypothetical protein